MDKKVDVFFLNTSPVDLNLWKAEENFICGIGWADLLISQAKFGSILSSKKMPWKI